MFVSMNKTYKYCCIPLFATILVLFTTLLHAEPTIQEQAEEIKSEIVELTRELSALEHKLLYPAESQLNLFLSTDTPSAFILDSIEVKLDGKQLTTYLYSEGEVASLEKGGIQRLFVGNIDPGKHTLEAIFNGQGVDDHYFRRNKSFVFTKGDHVSNIQMIISTSSRSFEPKMTFKDWQK